MISRFPSRNLAKRLYSQAATKQIITDLNERSISATVQELSAKILSLNMLEVADLVKILKKELNISDSMMMPMSAMPSNAVASSATVAAAAAPPKEAEKTEFKVILEKYDAAGKAKIIREIKALMPNLNLVEAKNFVEGVPKVIKESVKKEEAEKIKKTIEELGGTIKFE